MPNSPTRAVVCFAGPRDHYEGAAALAESGQLERLVTDAYFGAQGWHDHAPRALGDYVEARRHPLLNSARVSLSTRAFFWESVGRCVAHPLVRYRTHGGNISFGGLEADSSEIVRRIVRLQKNRFLLALSQVEDLNLHSANGAVVSDALIKYQAVNLAEAELEDRIASGKYRIVKTAYILKCTLCLRLRFAAAAWLFFIYVIPRGYAFALWIRKKQRLLS